MMLYEIIAIIAVVSFVIIVFSKAIYDFLHGKSSCSDCHGNCKNCASDAKEKMKKYLEDSRKIDIDKI